MIDGKCIAVVMPAYNAERTLEKTVRGLPEIVDIRILVDDSSSDQTAAAFREPRCTDLYPRCELWLWTQPANLLP